ANSELEAALTWAAASHPVVHCALSAAGCVLGLAELPCLQLRFRLRSRPELAVAAPVYEALAAPGGGQQVQLYQDNDGPAEVVAFVSSSVQNLRDPAAVASICRRLAARMLARLASQRVAGSAAVSAAELDDFRRQLMRAHWPKLVAPADGSIPSNSALDPRVEAF
uniref:Rubis-subs-bind domain-containing protein n=1 Tax=Macrostomum lignano TaxID=282301 RepID=A0A1I8GTP7_9PLAT